MSGTVIDVTDADFDSVVVQVPGPVLAVFRAEWSSVCLMLDPVLEEVAKEYAGRLTIARLDIDEWNSRKTPPKYNITAIPTLHVFKGGEIVNTWIGPTNKARVVATVKPYL
ncbi:thioredoxin family protein [Streptomyces sp. NPDC098077]|uniref:thioredoxin family protein n=1 Tax=Streptomyces sp. NPDC098077 TaxID=3366093 RepID=UPI0038140962